MKGKFERSAKLSGPVDQAEAERIAIETLAFLTADEGRLYRFLDGAGLDPGSLRQAAADPGFLAGILDHVVQDEPLMIACAETLAIPPERVAAAWQRLSPQEFS